MKYRSGRSISTNMIMTAWCSGFTLHDEPLLQAALDDVHIWRIRHALLEAFPILY